MWLIAGLGNPGPRYVKTRHNVGFLVLEEFSERQNLPFKERKDCRTAKGLIDSKEIVLLEPLTFMNRSGAPVRKIAERYSICPEEIIVVHDDLDIDTGRLKIRRKGSSGGHKGVESIIQSICSDDFIRIKVGIGRGAFVAVEDYVLSRFVKEELPLMKEGIKNAVDALHCVITEGVDKAMNRFNRT